MSISVEGAAKAEGTVIAKDLRSMSGGLKRQPNGQGSWSGVNDRAMVGN